MPERLICPQGHTWDGPPTCPACGAAAVSPLVDRAEAATLPPGTAALADPPPLSGRPGHDWEEERLAETLVAPRSDAAAMAALPRPVVAGYQILAELGRGGMGVVYQARQVGLNRLVALKMILAGAHAQAADLARFRTEAEAVAGLRHPHIVQIYDIGEQGGLPYFSLEFVEGGSLEGRLDGTPWLGPPAARLMEPLARAMHAAHQKGIIHRDLKPANVLLTAEGTPKVTDFGLAKRLDQDSGQTRTGTIMGTPSYMAPEQASGAKADIGPAADVYALGAVLYELLTGRPPFKAVTPLDTVLQVIQGDPVPPAQLNARVSRDLETICLKCLQKEPARRYASAEALADDLSRYLKGEPIHARPVGRLEKLGRWCRRNPVVAGLTTLVALVLIAGVVVSWYFAVQAGRRERQAARRLYVADLRLVQQAWENDELGRVRDLLDGQRPEHTNGTDFRGFEWYYWDRQWRMGHPDLEEHRWGVACVAFSPDGRLLASAGWDQVVNVRDAASGRVLHTLAGHADTIYGLAFSPDGGRLASAGADRTVRVWETSTGRSLVTLTGHTSVVHAVLFTPDGRSLISAGEDREGAVKIWDTGGGPPVASLADGSPVYGLALSTDGTRLASGGKDSTIRLWDVSRREQVATITGHHNTVAALAFSPDAKQLAAGDWDGQLKVWKVADGRAVVEQVHGQAVLAVAYSPDGKLVASAGRDREPTVRLWDAADGRQVRVLKGHTLSVRGLAFSQDSRSLASASEDHTVRVWDVIDAGTRPRPPLGRELTPQDFAPDGRPLDATAHLPLVLSWDRVGRQATLTFTRHTEAVRRVFFSPDRTHLASLDWKRNLFLWDLDGHVEALPLPEELPSPLSVAFSPDGQRLAVGGRDRVVILRAGTGAPVEAVLRGHTAQVRDLAFSPDGRRLASASEDGTVRVWTTGDGAEMRDFTAHVGSVMAVAFASDGRRLASGGEDQTVRIWDVDRNVELHSFTGHKSTVSCVAFSPDGQRVASGSADRTIRLWEAATGRQVAVLQGHGLGVNAVAFSPENRTGVRRLASASDDGTVKLWDAGGGQEILTLRGHADGVLGLSFSPGARRLASAGKDNKVKVWQAED
jgi:WD40 repeat protein